MYIYSLVRSAHLASGAVSHVVSTRRAVVPVNPLESRADVRWALVDRLPFHQLAYKIGPHDVTDENIVSKARHTHSARTDHVSRMTFWFVYRVIQTAFL